MRLICFECENFRSKIYRKIKKILEIQFKSSPNEGKRLANLLPYKLPEGERVFTRKAQYQYGWDWGSD
ncbi:hypothetical protein OBK23_10110 [Empedobacter falsenii]|uniref:glycosyl hydrolase 2 galactose-binding domain-containing protein n=1 Tax=Empedobacter falsenii TaxID=343874 RepID=UPI003A7F8EE3